MRSVQYNLLCCLRRRVKWKMPLAVNRLKARYMSARRPVKIAVFLVASLVIFFYVIPHVVEFARIRNQHFYKTKNLDACITQKLKSHENAIAHFETVAIHDALPFHHSMESVLPDESVQTQLREPSTSNTNDASVASHYLAFIGNGYIGVHLRFPGGTSVGDLLVRADRTITLSTTYNPLFRVELDDYARESSLLVEFRDGLLRELSCFRKNDLCVSAERVAYVHRVYPSLLIQEVHVANPTKQAITFRLTSTSQASSTLRLEPLTPASLAKLAEAAVTTDNKRVEVRSMYVRDTELSLGPKGNVLPVRLLLEAISRSPNDVSALTGTSERLQLVAVATINYGPTRDWAAESAADPSKFSQVFNSQLDLQVTALSSRTHIECTFVRSRTLTLRDADAAKIKIQAEVGFLEADVNEDMLRLAPRFCRFQLAAAASSRTQSETDGKTQLRKKPRKIKPENVTFANRQRRDLPSVALASSVDDQAAVEHLAAYTPLQKLHTLGWNALYTNGSSFEISYSKAPLVLNPVRINATLFYLLGHVPLFGTADLATRIVNNSATRNVLERPENIDWNAPDDILSRAARYAAPNRIGMPRTLDACYDSRVSTLVTGASSALWQPVFDVRSLAAVADAWLVTLTKKRCAPLLRAGAFGLLEAAVLSFGPFHFAHSHTDRAPNAAELQAAAGGMWNWDDTVHRHVELAADPKDLHRDRMRFGRLFFNEMIALDVRVELEDKSNKPYLFIDAERILPLDDPDVTLNAGDLHDDALEQVAAERIARWPTLTLFATDAELKTIVELQVASGARRTAQATRFALKYTEPATALLYVAESRQHLDELRVATSVISVQEFEAHPAEVISLHREGHSFGGLPTGFWVLIATLIVVFHLFLIKLIFDEFCSPNRRRYTSSAEMASHGQVWRFGASFRRQRNGSSNSSDVFTDEHNAASNAMALKRLLQESASRSRQDSSGN